MITVRLPESLHESLKAEAADHNTSMNKLCITKLLMALIDEQEQTQMAQPRTSPAAPAVQNAPQTPPAAASNPAAPNPANTRQTFPQQTQNPTSGFRSTFGQQ